MTTSCFLTVFSRQILKYNLINLLGLSPEYEVKLVEEDLNEFVGKFTEGLSEAGPKGKVGHSLKLLVVY